MQRQRHQRDGMGEMVEHGLVPGIERSIGQQRILQNMRAEGPKRDREKTECSSDAKHLALSLTVRLFSARWIATSGRDLEVH